ncbi:Izh4p PWA37_003946 [Arxiozyma heterogenica]|uniref:Izh4p n=1 Tax=Arxiozyma heterogenica TaxID=278026 RepID=UPI002EED25BB
MSLSLLYSIITIKQDYTENKQIGKPLSTKDKAKDINSIQLFYLHELPEWQKNNNNPYITYGYLKETNSYRGCFKALTIWNNQSFNIVFSVATSILFFLLLVLFADIYLVPNYPSTTMTDYIVINLYLATAFQSSFFNATASCFRIHSLVQSRLWSKISNLGLIYHLTTCTISILYYCYYDNVFYFKLLTIFTFMSAIVMTLIILTDFFDRPKYLDHKGLLFVTFGAFLTLVPLSLGVMKFGKDKVVKRIDLNILSIEIGLYLLSALFYIMKLPERFIVISHRYQLTSQNFFYICFFLATLCHLNLLINSFVLMRSGDHKPTFVSFT